MSFYDNLTKIQKELKLAGYQPINEPYDFLGITRDQETRDQEKISDCEIIAKKDYYKIIYLEVKSNWRGIATDILKSNPSPCMIITKYKDEHIFCSVLQDHATLHSKPRHVLIDTESKGHSWSNFVKLIKVSHEDDLNSIDDKVHNAFDKFSDYSDAVKKFGENLDAIITKTKKMIDDTIAGNSEYDLEAKKILKMCQEVINDKMELKDVEDMLLQHVLTYRIFALVYDEQDFHNTNTVAKSLESLKNLLCINTNEIKYDKMELIAESITDSDQRQEFLKKFYETFYKKYDPAKAEKDGIVYTPNEVVNFMVKSTDQLLKKHFGKSLSDENVTILDPATGTGTFPVNILKEISIDKLESKYTKEIHVNEISILPYYIAALNIEHTYKELTGRYKEFENICWMDTLDSGTKDYEKLTTYFSEDDNVQRISQQQKSKICVVIGNPPYNAKQTNFNDANPANKYPHIDKKIKEEYYKNIKITNTNKAFDMYKRFLKWSSERIKGNGMVVFVSNNSFLESNMDRGIRQSLYREFDYVYIVNLKGKSRDTFGDEAKKQGGNVFGVRVGITISFFVKLDQTNSDIQYVEISDYMNQDEKLKWLDQHSLLTLKFRKIIPNKSSIWLNQTNNDFNDLLPVLPREHDESIFRSSSRGVSTAKDRWTYSLDKENLENKIDYYILTYNKELKKTQNQHIKNLGKHVTKKIKWSEDTLKGLQRGHKLTTQSANLKPTLYRPFIIRWQYYEKIITERCGKFQDIFKNHCDNLLICFPNPATDVAFNTIGTNIIIDYKCMHNTQAIPLWRYDESNNIDNNITSFALKLFRNHYKDKTIVPEDIFYYVYAVFNDPKYEQTYRHDLRRHFPRIPLTKNFTRYSILGKKLFELHCNFDNVKEYDLERIDVTTHKKDSLLTMKTKDELIIVIDHATTLKNIPNDVLEYSLEGRNPLKWILDLHKQKINELRDNDSNDKSIQKKFNTYNFADHKEDVITLLKKVTTVCIETVKLRKELEQLEWGPQPKLKFTPIEKKSIKKSKSTKKESKITIRQKPKFKIVKPKKTKSANIGEYL